MQAVLDQVSCEMNKTAVKDADCTVHLRTYNTAAKSMRMLHCLCSKTTLEQKKGMPL